MLRQSTTARQTARTINATTGWGIVAQASDTRPPWACWAAAGRARAARASGSNTIGAGRAISEGGKGRAFQPGGRLG